MKKEIIVLSLFLLSIAFNGQTTLKEYKAGHTFSVSAPAYMTKTTGLNKASTIEFKNLAKDVYTFVIVDTKEELRLLELNYSLIEYYEDFTSTFLKSYESKEFSKPISSKKGNTNFMEFEASVFDADIKTKVYYLAGIVETEKSYYRVVSWTTMANKDKYKADFQKTLYSLID
jgi:hypothetical protein